MSRGDPEEGLKHIARYVEYFESPSKEIWLVFRNEGVSLSKLIYTTEDSENIANERRGERVKNIQVLHPSTWWRWLRTTEAGKEEMRSLIWQLLMALKSCHDRNITHRDIKPGEYAFLALNLFNHARHNGKKPVFLLAFVG
uniref:Protein kinase domain-containing protein n=1 Tax=Nelumbo nucifera TaxID=4432 RepID=A0A822XFI7_NELNU|nr:TPA_asm: hypothetical protein HUJ06_019249 [Nelumbo nucifera]